MCGKTCRRAGNSAPSCTPAHRPQAALPGRACGLSATPSSCISRLLPMQTRTSTVLPLSLPLSLLLLLPMSLPLSPMLALPAPSDACCDASSGASKSGLLACSPTVQLPLSLVPAPAAAARSVSVCNCVEATGAARGSPARWARGTASQHLSPRPGRASEATAGASHATLRSCCACCACRVRHAQGCPPCN